MNKRTIVTDSKRASKAASSVKSATRPPHPLVGAEFVTGAAAMSQLPAPSVPEIAFAGRSNAGKSTAINVLAGRTRLAFASRTPGRTQQINLFSLRSGALVADLPGYGYAAVGKELKRAWQEFLWQYITTRPTLVALVLIVDSRHGLKELDLELLEGFVPSGRPILILATKGDKLNTSDQRAAVATVHKQLAEKFPLGATNVTVQLFSATARIGIAEAEAVISGWLQG
ncbi:MAG: ribosome biogenesis GTP-binding protein YihA/YsxC [Betaproteobacteria bacterium]